MADKIDLDQNINSKIALRAAAEKKLGKSLDTAQKITDKTSEEIIHELQVHQIELEMQNEELKRTRLELEGSRDKYENLYDFAPIGYFTLNHKGIIKEVNLNGATLLGMPRPKLLGRGFGHFVSPEYLDLWDRHLINVIGSKEKHTCDLILRNDTGSLFNAHLESIRLEVPTEIQPIFGGSHAVLAHVVVSDVSELKSAEKALKHSKELFRTVADFTYNWEYWVTAEDNFLYCSPSCERISGYSAEEFISDPGLMNRIIHPDDSNMMLEHYHNMRKVTPHATEAMEFRIIHRNGDTRWIGHVCQPICGQEGQFLGRRGSNRDITKRKHSETLTKLNESRLQSLYEISQFRAKNIQELLDLTLEQAIKLTTSKIGYIYHYEEDNQRFILNSWSKEVMKQCEIANPQNVYELAKTGIWGEAVRQRKAIIVNDFQAPNPLKKGYPPGHVELFRFLTVPVLEKDKVVAVVGVANKESDYDDSDSRQLSLLMDSVWRMIEILRATEREQQLISAVDHAAEGIIITDAAGIIQYVNPAEETITGYSRDELVGQTPSIFKSGKHEEIFYRKIWETINAGNVWSGRFINKRKDGTNYYEDATISPVFDNAGNLINFVAVKHDVTQQIELQEQLLQAQKMEAIGTLAGGVAHDFNNLLQIVLGYSEVMLQRKKQGEDDYVDLQQIYQAGKRGADLVKSLMTFSRKVEATFIPVDLNQEITTVRNLLSNTIPKTININLNLKGNLESIKADPSQIGQVLMNLGVNARDAMPNGGTLTFETTNVQLDTEYCNVYPETRPGSYILLTVSDTGQGMDKETLSHIFEPFFTTKETGKGTGLGLSTVYGIVKQHGGHITCHSEPGIGTTFNIYFPAIEKEMVSETPIVETPIPSGTETILLVDDEESLRDLGIRFLNTYGYRVITASNGKEALEIYRKMGDTISLIMLDWLMPVMDGRQCLAGVLRINPDAKIVIASGASECGPASEARVAGAKGFVQKPYNMRQLLSMVREVLDKDVSGPQ